MGTQAEATDRPLSALVISVEQEDREALLLARKRGLHHRAVLVVRPADAGLPEPRVGGRHIEIAKLLAEVLLTGMLLLSLAKPSADDVPVMEDRHAGTHVAEGDGHHDVVAVALDRSQAVAGHQDLARPE